MGVRLKFCLVTGIARQTGQFTVNVMGARGADGVNLVSHSQGTALVNAGINNQIDEHGVFTNLQSTASYQDILKGVSVFNNGSPMSNWDVMVTLGNAGIDSFGSNANDGDFVAGVLGGNRGVYSNNDVVNTVSLSTGTQPALPTDIGFIKRILSVPDFGALFGDAYPVIVDGQQTNNVSPHSTYNCLKNCGSNGEINPGLNSNTATAISNQQGDSKNE